MWETVHQRVCEVWESLSNSMQAVPSSQLLSQTPHETLIFRSQFCCYFAPIVLRVFCLCKTPHAERDKANGKMGKGRNKTWLRGIADYDCAVYWFWTELRVNISHTLSATAMLTQSGCSTCVSSAIAIFQSLLLENCSNSHTLNDSSCSPLPQRYHEKAVPYTEITLVISKGVEEGC